MFKIYQSLLQIKIYVLTQFLQEIFYSRGPPGKKKLMKNSNSVSDFIKKNVPLNKIGETSDISEMVLYLSSDSSKIYYWFKHCHRWRSDCIIINLT